MGSDGFRVGEKESGSRTPPDVNDLLISRDPLKTKVIERNTHVGDGKASRILNGNAEMAENSGFEIRKEWQTSATIDA